jgi:hypothetical protein
LSTSRTTKASWFDSDTYNRFSCSANHSHRRWDPTGVLFSGYLRLFHREQNSQFVKQAAHTLLPTLIGELYLHSPTRLHNIHWHKLDTTF